MKHVILGAGPAGAAMRARLETFGTARPPVILIEVEDRRGRNFLDDQLEAGAP